MLEHIREGVFFTTPPSLPRGRHELARGQVLSQQRERLMIATTEIMATDGYRRLGVREIASRAGVSRAAFYESFADKDACVFSAYDRFIAVLVERVVGVIDEPEDWDLTVRAVIEAYLATLSSDLVVTRAFQVEMDSLGHGARQRRRQALGAMAQALKERRDEVWPGAETVAITTYLGAIYAVRQLASDLVDEEHEPDLLALARQATPWLTELLGRPTHDFQGLRVES